MCVGAISPFCSGRTCGISAGRLSVVVVQGSCDFTCKLASHHLPTTVRSPNDAGVDVRLGILSAWEPPGGIFCASLPIIYRLVVTTFRNLRSCASGQPSRTHCPDLQEQCHRQWPHYATGIARRCPTTWNSLTIRRAKSSVFRWMSRNTIQEEQYCEQQVDHEGDETPLHPV